MKKAIILLMLVFLLQGCNKITSEETELTSNLTVSYITYELMNVNLYHNVNVEADPFITAEANLSIYEFKVNDELVSLSYIDYQENRIFFDHNYLNDFETKTHNLSLQTNNGIIVITLVLVDDYVPYIISDNNIHYVENQDVTVLIETFNKGIYSLSVTGGIDSSFYSFSGQTLLIKNEYFASLLANEPERANIIFMVTISYNEEDTLIAAINVIFDN